MDANSDRVALTGRTGGHVGAGQLVCDDMRGVLALHPDHVFVTQYVTVPRRHSSQPTWSMTYTPLAPS